QSAGAATRPVGGFMPLAERETAELDRPAPPRQLRCDRRLWLPCIEDRHEASSLFRTNDRAARVLVPIRARPCRYRARFLAAVFVRWNPQGGKSRNRPTKLTGTSRSAG